MKTSNGLTYTDPQGGVHRISGKVLWTGSEGIYPSALVTLEIGVVKGGTLAVEVAGKPVMPGATNKAISYVKFYMDVGTNNGLKTIVGVAYGDLEVYSSVSALTGGNRIAVRASAPEAQRIDDVSLTKITLLEEEI